MKIKELREMTVDELRRRRRELAEEQRNLVVQMSGGMLENTSRVRTVRREIARVETLLTERARTAGA